MSTVFKQAYVGDLQLPYGDDRAIALWFKVMKWWKPDAVDIVGDIDDLLEFSSFSNGGTDEFLNTVIKNVKENEKRKADYEKKLPSPVEVDKLLLSDNIAVVPEEPEYLPVDPVPFILQVSKPAKDFYTAVRTANPNTDLFAALGNHEQRVFNYVDTKLPDYKKEITPESLWDLQNLGIPYIYDKFDPPKERHGGVFVMHGQTTKGSSNAMAVSKDVDNYDVSIVRGHSHNGGVYYRPKPLSGRELWGMECGHLCDETGYGLRYENNPRWEKGFGINHIVEGTSFPQFIHIKNYTCVIDGRVFHG